MRSAPTGTGGSPANPPRSARFSWGEWAGVLLLVALLTAVGVPNLVRGFHRSARDEAMQGLRAIHEAQARHFAAHSEYSGSLAELGFSLVGGSLRPDGTYRGRSYTFTLSSRAREGVPHGAFRATAVADLDDGDTTLDIVAVEDGPIAQIAVISDEILRRTGSTLAAAGPETREDGRP